MALTLSRLTLAALAGIGFITLQLFSRSNGLFPLLESNQKKLVLPHSNISFDPTFTGVAAIDDVFSFVLMFFWPIVDGNHPGLALVSSVFGGQAVAAWTLTMIESVRRGNSWKAVSFISIYGILGQLLGIGMMAPLYLLFHTLTSPTSTTPTFKTISPSLCASIATIPATMTLAYITPMAVMSLPLSSPLITLDQKILAHHFWQIFPVTCSLTHLFLTSIWPFNPASTPPTIRHYLRLTYKFALAVAVPAHIAAITLSLRVSTDSAMFSAKAVEEWGLELWTPNLDALRFGSAKVDGIAQGALWFLQWDYVLVGTAYLVWALALAQQARVFVNSTDGFGVAGLLMVVTRLVLMGPVGAAVAYVWERDELVLDKAEEVERKKGL